MTRKKKLVCSLSEAGSKRRQRSGNKINTVLFIATLALAGMAQADFDGKAALSNYVAAVDKEAFLGKIAQDDPAAIRFVNNRLGQLATKDKDFISAVGYFQAAYDAGDEMALPRMIKFTRMSGDVRAALALEAQVGGLRATTARAKSYFELAFCKPVEEVNACLLKAAQSGRISTGKSNIAFVSRMLRMYRFLDAAPQQALEFLDAVDLMLEDTAETAAITGKIIDMKNEQKRREQ